LKLIQIFFEWRGVMLSQPQTMEDLSRRSHCSPFVPFAFDLKQKWPDLTSVPEASQKGTSRN